jgi:Transposase, Mutator family
VLSLYAKDLTTGEVSARSAEVCGASVSKETVSRITDRVVAEMQDWAVRPSIRGGIHQTLRIIFWSFGFSTASLIVPGRAQPVEHGATAQ